MTATAATTTPAPFAFEGREIAWKQFRALEGVYYHILGVDPANVPALAGLARYHMNAGDFEQATTLLGQVPAKEQNHAEVVAVKNGIEQPTPQPVADGKAAQGGDQRQDLPASCAV